MSIRSKRCVLLVVFTLLAFVGVMCETEDIEVIVLETSSSKDDSELINRESRRKLSSKEDYYTGESYVTYNGHVPETTCPVGYYRPRGGKDLHMVTGQRGDGCIQCPMGVYGSTVGLSLPTCTGSCPAGKFGTKLGQISANDCAFCPPGRFGSTSGAYGSESAFGKSPGVPCPGVCPRGKYSSKWGSITATDCKPCIKGYIGWQCTWAIQPRTGQDQDHQHNEYFGLKPNFKDPIPFTKRT